MGRAVSQRKDRPTRSYAPRGLRDAGAGDHQHGELTNLRQGRQVLRRWSNLCQSGRLAISTRAVTTVVYNLQRPTIWWITNQRNRRCAPANLDIDVFFCSLEGAVVSGILEERARILMRTITWACKASMSVKGNRRPPPRGIYLCLVLLYACWHSETQLLQLSLSV